MAIGKMSQIMLPSVIAVKVVSIMVVELEV